MPSALPSQYASIAVLRSHHVDGFVLLACLLGACSCYGGLVRLPSLLVTHRQITQRGNLMNPANAGGSTMIGRVVMPALRCAKRIASCVAACALEGFKKPCWKRQL